MIRTIHITNIEKLDEYCFIDIKQKYCPRTVAHLTHQN